MGQRPKEIWRLLERGPKTASEISDELGLAASTTSEHIKRLEELGAIERVDNPFIRKWQYWRQNPNFDSKNFKIMRRPSIMPQIVATMAVIIGLLALFTVLAPAFVAGSSLTFSLTDPPVVPNGTTALNITYSSLQAHVINGNSSSWISGSGSGTLDLMKLINTSEVIGSGKISANATVDMVKFAITSAKIVINGTAYNVTVPSDELTAHVTGTSRATENSSILIDLSPVVTSIFTGNSTVFVMLPSVKAVFIGNERVHVRQGERTNLTSEERDDLGHAGSSIKITSVSLSLAGNDTVFSVTVKNNGNKSVVIRHVSVRGRPLVTVSNNAIENGTIRVNVESRPMFGRDLSANISLNGSDNITESHSHPMISADAGGEGDAGAGGMGGRMATINGIHVSVMEHGIPTLINDSLFGNELHSRMMKVLVGEGEKIEMFRNLNFLVTSNGTLVLPFVQMVHDCHEEEPCGVFQKNIIAGDTGFVLGVGASETFKFSGPILFAKGHIGIAPVVGNNYEITVGGDEGAFATANVLAS